MAAWFAQALGGAGVGGSAESAVKDGGTSSTGTAKDADKKDAKPGGGGGWFQNLVNQGAALSTSLGLDKYQDVHLGGLFSGEGAAVKYSAKELGSLIAQHNIGHWNSLKEIQGKLDIQMNLAKKCPLKRVPIKDGLKYFKDKAGNAEMSKEKFIKLALAILVEKKVKHTANDENELGEVFKAMDFDNNGSIDKGEWAAGLSVFFKGSMDECLSAVFQVLDDDGSESISKKELELYFRPFLKAMMPAGSEPLRPLLLRKIVDDIFKEMDDDGKDNISLMEMTDWSKTVNKETGAPNNIIDRIAQIVDAEVYKAWMAENQKAKKKDKKAGVGSPRDPLASSASLLDPSSSGQSSMFQSGVMPTLAGQDSRGMQLPPTGQLPTEGQFGGPPPQQQQQQQQQQQGWQPPPSGQFQPPPAGQLQPPPTGQLQQTGYQMQQQPPPQQEQGWLHSLGIDTAALGWSQQSSQQSSKQPRKSKGQQPPSNESTKPEKPKDSNANYGESTWPTLWREGGIPLPPTWSRYDPALCKQRWRNIPPPPDDSQRGKENSYASSGNRGMLPDDNATFPARPPSLQRGPGGHNAGEHFSKESSAQYTPSGFNHARGSQADAYSVARAPSAAGGYARSTASGYAHSHYDGGGGSHYAASQHGSAGGHHNAPSQYGGGHGYAPSSISDDVASYYPRTEVSSVRGLAPPGPPPRHSGHMRY